MNQVASQTSDTATRGRRISRTGKVVSKSGDKTIKVRYDYTVKHPKYGKYMRKSTFLHAHDAENTAKMGDVVEVVDCRRLSKTKCWRLMKIIRSE